MEFARKRKKKGSVSPYTLPQLDGKVITPLRGNLGTRFIIINAPKNLVSWKLSAFIIHVSTPSCKTLWLTSRRRWGHSISTQDILVKKLNRRRLRAPNERNWRGRRRVVGKSSNPNLGFHYLHSQIGNIKIQRSPLTVTSLGQGKGVTVSNTFIIRWLFLGSRKVSL